MSVWSRLFGSSKEETSNEELVFESEVETRFKGFKKVSSSSEEDEDPAESSSESESSQEYKDSVGSFSESSSSSSSKEDAKRDSSQEYEDPAESFSESFSSKEESVEVDFGKFCKCLVEVSETYNENVGTVIGAYLGNIELFDKFVEVFEKLQNFQRIGLIMIPENFFRVQIEADNTIAVTKGRLQESKVKRITDVEIGSAMDLVQIQMMKEKTCRRAIEIGNLIKYNYIFNVGSRPNESLFGVEGSDDMHRLATQEQLSQISTLKQLGVHPPYVSEMIFEGDLKSPSLYLVTYEPNFDSDNEYDLKNISERLEIIKTVCKTHTLRVDYNGFMRDSDSGKLYLYYPTTLTLNPGAFAIGYDTRQEVASAFRDMLGDHYSVLEQHPEFVQQNRKYIEEI